MSFKDTFNTYFFRARVDGKRRLGVLPLVLAGGFMFAVIFWMRQHFEDPQFSPSASERAPAAPAPQVERIAQAATSLSEVQQARAQRQGTSFRGAAEIEEKEFVVEAEEDTLDLIDTLETSSNLGESANAFQGRFSREGRQTGRLRPPIDAQSEIVVRNPPPERPPPTIAPQEVRQLELDGAFVVYSNPDLGKAPPAPEEPEPLTGFDTGNFLPRGFRIPIVVISNIETGNQEALIEMAVAANVRFRSRLLIKFGTRLLGSAASATERNRVIVNADTLLYPDGRELPISGTVQGLDFVTGIPGYFVAPPIESVTFPFAADFLDELVEFYEESLEEVVVTDTSTSTSQREFQLAEAATAALGDASAEMIRQYGDQLLAQTRPFVRVPSGTRGYIQLRTPLDLTEAVRGGSRNSTASILPGFENNPFLPSGQLARDVGSGARAPSSGQPLASAPAAEQDEGWQPSELDNELTRASIDLMRQMINDGQPDTDIDLNGGGQDFFGR